MEILTLFKIILKVSLLHTKQGHLMVLTAVLFILN